MNTIVHAPSSPFITSLARILKDFVGAMNAGLTRVDSSELSVYAGTDAAIARVDAQRDRMRMQVQL